MNDQQPPAATGIVVHIPFAAAERWRCVWHGRGAGTVLARIEVAGIAWGYDVRLDTAGGAQQRAWPCDLRRVPALAAMTP